MTPVDAGAFEPTFQRNAVVGRAGLANIIAGTDAGLAINRDRRLLNELVAACERLLRQLNRSGLPLTAREEIHAQIGRVAAAAGLVRQRLADGEALDVNEHVLGASGYFDHLAPQLGTHGFADRPVTLRLTDEARALIRLAGGRGGSSDSAP